MSKIPVAKGWTMAGKYNSIFKELQVNGYFALSVMFVLIMPRFQKYCSLSERKNGLV